MEYRTLEYIVLSVSAIALGGDTRCPFGVAIIDSMARAEARFGY